MRRGAWSLLMLGGATACNGLAGIDDLRFESSAGGASAVASSTTTASVGSGGATTTVSTGAGGGGSKYAAAVLADNPLGYWRLGEAQGSPSALDASGNDHDGNYVGVVDLVIAGALTGDPDTAAHFDGNAKVVVGDVFDFVGLASFSVEAWVKQDPSQNGYQGICGKLTNSPGDGYVLYMTNPGHPKFSVFSNGMSADATLGAAVATDSYTHLVGTFDGTTVELFVNGIPSTTVGISAGPVADTTALFTLADNTQGVQFEGAIDEVAVYASALSAERVAAHYDAAMSP